MSKKKSGWNVWRKKNPARIKELKHRDYVKRKEKIKARISYLINSKKGKIGKTQITSFIFAKSASNFVYPAFSFRCPPFLITSTEMPNFCASSSD